MKKIFDDYLKICYKIKALTHNEKNIDIIIQKIIKIYEDQILVFIDDIYSEESFDRIKKIINFEDFIQSSTIKFNFYIQFNSLIFETIYYCLKDGIKFISVRNSESEESLENDYSIDVEINDYKNKIKINFQNLENKNKNLITFLKLKYYTSSEYILMNDSIIYEIKDFFNYLTLDFKVWSHIKIRFRNKIIKDIANQFFQKYFTKYINENISKLSNIISQSQQGGFLEKNIILDLITDVNKNSLLKIDVDTIFCFKTFSEADIEILKKNLNIIFLQNLINAPKYDFAILFSYTDNNIEKIYLDVYQVGLNKTNEDLEKLNHNLIKFDINFFVYKLNKIIKKK